MAGGGDRKTFVLALATAGLAMVLTRFPLGTASTGLWFFLVAAASLLLLGLPVVLAESALGQYRRRNAVDAYGQGPWRLAGLAHAVGALLAAALVAILAGWAARFAYGSLQGDWFDDPARYFRLYSAGPDALITTLAVLAVAIVVAVRGSAGGLRGTVALCATAVLLVITGLAVWANVQSGAAAGRADLLAFDTGGVDASFVVRALFAGLLPALLATGLASSLASSMQDRTLPRELVTASIVALLGLFGLLLALAPMAEHEGLSFGEGLPQAFAAVPAVFASYGGAVGGFLAGSFFVALLLAALVALVALLEVPAKFLAESEESWTEGRGFVAAGLAAFLLAVPFCFSAGSVVRLEQVLAWVLAPFGAFLASVYVGWRRPEVLDGFRVGDAGHHLDATLRPVLRYVLGPVFLGLMVLGLLGVIHAAGNGGSGGLWDLAP